MQRLSMRVVGNSPRILTQLRQPLLFQSTRRLASGSQNPNEASHDSGPGWKGRPTDDHAVNRDSGLDVQSDAAHSGMKQHEKGEEGSQGLSRKDEGNNNQKAKEDHPEAPGPVLGMNDESR